MIEWLGKAEGDADTLGGKAASLDRLARLGFRIPPGFCVTTAAFRAQLRSINVSVADERAGEAIEGAAIEPEIATPLAEAIARLCSLTAERGNGAGEFAVRSSAIGEDGGEASYAGLHETELGVAPDGIDASIRRCWASLWSAPALAYRQRRALPLEGGAMAVVVQALVPADAAIVGFTRHPVTGRDDQLVVTAVRGLGDAMVSGTVTPDTFVIDRATRRVIEFSPGDGGPPAIGGAILDELIELLLRIEAGFGAAVDVEAALAGSDWYLLQARPITTGGARPAVPAG
jgi:phosphoenolpyruvate synthase/pyruvate phosphate dikinase